MATLQEAYMAAKEGRRVVWADGMDASVDSTGGFRWTRAPDGPRVVIDQNVFDGWEIPGRAPQPEHKPGPRELTVAVAGLGDVTLRWSIDNCPVKPEEEPA